LVVALLLTTPSVWAQSTTTTYTYDEIGRLKTVVRSNGTSAAYDLDAAGNRRALTIGVDTTAPTVPTGLSGSAASPTLINLNWTASTDTGGSGVSVYRVFRSGSQIGTTAATSYADTTVVGSNTYGYSVAAQDVAGNVSAQSGTVNVSTPDGTPPSVPANLSASAPSSTQVNLSWTASTDTGGSGLAGYRVYRGGSLVGSPTTNSWSDTSVVGSTSYSYSVAAIDNAGNLSGQSSAANVTTPDTIAPSVPTNVAATAVSTSQINVTWTPSTDTGGSGLATHRVYRDGTYIGTGTASFSATGLAASTTYAFRISAVDNAGNESAQSSPPATATTGGGSPPAAPNPTVNPTLLTTGGSTTLQWAADANATYYEVDRSFNGFAFTLEYSGTATSRLYTNMSAGSWTYRVRACNGFGCSTNSYQLDVTVCNVSGCD
jgi:YD repeat-containing protein